MSERTFTAKTFAGLLLAVLTVFSPLFASTQGENSPVSAEIYTVDNSSAEGLLVAVRMTIAPGWHVYWKNPGEAGMPVEIRWELPDGYQALPLEYPAPERFESGGLAGFGYSGEVVLFSRIVPVGGKEDRSFSEDRFPLKAELSWLSCGEVCIPGSASLNLDASPAGKERLSLAGKFRKRVPERLDGADLAVARASVISEGGMRSLELVFSGPEAAEIRAFYPLFPEKGLDLNAIAAGPASVVLQLKDDAAPERVEGVLETTRSVYLVDASLRQGGRRDPPGALASLPVMLGLAFVGGVLLNIMPCVLPVLGLKVFSLVGSDRQGDSRKTGRYLSLVFAAGVLLSFWVLAAFVWVLQGMGEQVGWGFQFQSPVFLMFIAVVVFAFGMNLFGLYEFNAPVVSGKIGRVASHRDALGAFVSGVLATTLATPCTAPFLGTALGFAFSQPPLVIFLFFTVIALGMAAPYVLLAWHPAWLKFLPKPGHWMYLFKQFMGFILVAVVIWLASILGAQGGSPAVSRLLGLLFAVAFVLWAVGAMTARNASLGRRLAVWGVALLLLVALFVRMSSGLTVRGELSAGQARQNTKVLADGSGLVWHDFSPALLDSLREEGRTVFLDFTADWCITCKVLEASVLRNGDVVAALRDDGVVAVRADWTTKNDSVTALLRKFGRSGVPLLVIIPRGDIDKAIVLPEVVTVDMLLAALRDARE
ncbi:thiol:disulfide interchange protein [Prosthecochloris sp. GSB1]|nr:thiol:disulfide interchange protein [Prosthecochloris sp. GSB1]